uniref:C2H2-type domain-containing protein n=1 Tax=Timema bartmani TaxID=61472 RepID=A0A7R9HWF0_9NEOP|nr:unnamed protein product [Timema bartmani]
MGRRRRYFLSGKQDRKCEENTTCWPTARSTRSSPRTSVKIAVKGVPNMRELIGHHPINKEQVEDRCIECRKFYSTKSVLILHYNIHRLYLRYGCTECHEYFLSKNGLSVHSHRTDTIQLLHDQT